MLRSSLFLLLMISACSPLPRGSGNSRSLGSVGNGSLQHGRKFAYYGTHYRYFSPLSYHLLGRAWVHQKVAAATLEAYAALAEEGYDQRFMIMECSKREGGRMRPHRSHQNGTSIDFGTPLLKYGRPYTGDQALGIWHYAMDFSPSGQLRLRPWIRIDFEAMGKHILALDAAARHHGMYVKKVILKLDLKDDFYASQAGQEVKAKGIYLAQRLPRLIDEVHDDHYHVDFGFLE